MTIISILLRHNNEAFRHCCEENKLFILLSNNIFWDIAFLKTFLCDPSRFEFSKAISWRSLTQTPRYDVSEWGKEWSGVSGRGRVSECVCMSVCGVSEWVNVHGYTALYRLDQSARGQVEWLHRMYPSLESNLGLRHDRSMLLSTGLPNRKP